MKITREWIHQHATHGKGWTCAQLNLLGVKWPPRKGWLSALIGTEISEDVRAAFEEATRKEPAPASAPKSPKSKKWRAVIASIPLELRRRYAYGLHMHERPDGTSRQRWASVWIDQHAAKWPLELRIALGKAPIQKVECPSRRLQLSPRVKYQIDKPIRKAAADNAFLQSYEWRQLRMLVLKKRGARCECCGASPKDGVTVINVDHIKPRRDFPELALVESNLQVLCAVCNHGKGNWDQTDWREPPTASPSIPADKPWLECGQSSWKPPPSPRFDPSNFRSAGQVDVPMWWKPEKGN